MFRKSLFIFLLLFSFSASAEISQVGGANSFTGLSTDTKPTTVEAGSRFYETDTVTTYEYDGTTWYSTKWRGALNIHDADVHHLPINELFHNHTGTETTIAVAATAQATSIQVVDGSGFANGDSFHLSNGVVEATFPKILSGGGTNTFQLDRPLDNPYSVGSKVEQVITNMAVDGSITPVAFRMIADLEQDWHLQTFLLVMIHAAAGDGTTFGGLPALTKGCVIRGFNAETGLYRTFAVWKSNADIELSMGHIDYDGKIGGGKPSVVGDGDIKGRTGAVPLLHGSLVDDGSFVELLVQDDLTEAGSSVFLKGQGHVEGL